MQLRRRDVARRPEWWRLGTEHLAILLAVTALHALAISCLMAPPKQPKHRLPVVGQSTPMQLIWIPRGQPAAPDRPQPSATTTAQTTTATIPLARVRPSGPRRNADATTIEVDPAADRELPAWDARRDLLGIRTLLLTLPAPDAAQAPHVGEHFSGGRDAIRLPGDGPPKVEGIVVHAEEIG